MRRPTLTSLVSIALAVGCNVDAPTDTGSPAPNFVVAGNSGCHAVSGKIVQSGAFPNFQGTISGDIEGTVVTTIDPASASFPGIALLVRGDQTWEVTGGTVGGLTTVHLELNSTQRAAQPPLLGLKTTARVIDGAESGNLTYHGFVDVSGFPILVDVDYHGVICP